MKRKILHIVFSLDPGGMENGLINVARELPADEFQVDVCCLERRGAFVDRLPEESTVLVLNKKPGKSVTTLVKLCAYVAMTRPDVIHTHNLGPLAHAVWATFGGVLAPILHSEHGEIIPDERTPSRLRQRSRYFKCCKGIHTVSAGLTTHVQALFGLKKVHTIANGVDSTRFKPGKRDVARERLGLSENAFVIGVVGRFVEIKRQHVALDAFLDLAESIPDARLLMPGDGPTHATIVETAKNSPFADRVLLPGHMDEPETAYQAMDALLMPCLLEGMSNVMLEAMSSGVPCVAHHSFGCAEVIAHNVNGLLVEMGDDATLKSLLSDLAKGTYDLPRLGKAARKTVTASYSIESMAAGYADLYRSIIGGR